VYVCISLIKKIKNKRKWKRKRKEHVIDHQHQSSSCIQTQHLHQRQLTNHHHQHNFFFFILIEEKRFKKPCSSLKTKFFLTRLWTNFICKQHIPSSFSLASFDFLFFLNSNQNYMRWFFYMIMNQQSSSF